MRGHSTRSAHILLLRVPASNVSIMFYIPLQQYHNQGNKVDFLGVPTFNICYVASRLGEIEAFAWYLYRVPGTRYWELKLKFHPGDLPHNICLVSHTL